MNAVSGVAIGLLVFIAGLCVWLIVRSLAGGAVATIIPLIGIPVWSCWMIGRATNKN
jgi:hypothetical protein